MADLIERIIPVCESIDKKYKSLLKTQTEIWFFKWFGEHCTVYPGAVENIERNVSEELLVSINGKPIMRFCCSLDMLIRLLSEQQIGENRGIALTLITKITEDLVGNLRVEKASDINISCNNSPEAIKQFATISVETKRGFIEVDFFAETYASYLDFTYSQVLPYIAIDPSHKTTSLGQEKVKLNLEIDQIRITAEQLVSLKVGQVLMSKNKLNKPVPLRINDKSFTSAYLGMKDTQKVIKIGE